jgi:hypothetical protein
VGARACAGPHVCARTRARAHRRSPPRTTARAASTTGRGCPACGGAPLGPKAAHTPANVVTAAVFHAPMSALNAEATANACEPSHPRSTPMERARTVRQGCFGAQSHTHTRALTDAARGRVCAAGPHRRPVHRCSQPRMDIDSCMHCVYIHCVCACSIDGWPYEESAPHSRTCRALAHRHRPHAIARDRTRTQEHTRAPIYIPGLCVDIYIHLYTCTLDVCVGHTCRRTYPRAHVMATAASSARAIARTRAWEAVQPHARPYPSLTQVHIYLYTYV